MIQETVARVTNGESLNEETAEQTMALIMDGKVSPELIAAYLVALRNKGETSAEIAGSARAMRARAVPLPVQSRPLADTCGTGGDGSNSFNISTTAALVAAGAGLKVAKHGNRSVSSKAGSADILEALGVDIDQEPERVAHSIDTVGFGFLFAPRFHTAMKHAIGPRREIGGRSIFNLLGPLTNPAQVEVQVVGVYDGSLTETLAEVLGRLGLRRAMVIHGAGGLDELSLSGPNRISEWHDGSLHSYTLDAADVGLESAPNDVLVGGDARVNAELVRRILQGEKGPRRSVVLLNTAAALRVAGLSEDWRECVQIAADAIDGGKAWAVLEALTSNKEDKAAL